MPDPGKEGPRRLRPVIRTRVDGKLDRPGRKSGRVEAADAVVRQHGDVSGSSAGEFLRQTREMQRLTLRQLAEETKHQSEVPVSRATIAAIESGTTDPTLTTVRVLAKALRLSPAEVMERADITAPTLIDVSGVDRRELRSRAEACFWSGNYREALTLYDAMLAHLELNPPASAGKHDRERARIESARESRSLAPRFPGAAERSRRLKPTQSAQSPCRTAQLSCVEKPTSLSQQRFRFKGIQTWHWTQQVVLSRYYKIRIPFEGRRHWFSAASFTGVPTASMRLGLPSSKPETSCWNPATSSTWPTSKVIWGRVCSRWVIEKRHGDNSKWLSGSPATYPSLLCKPVG